MLGVDPGDPDPHSLEEFTKRGNRLVIAFVQGPEVAPLSPLEKAWGIRYDRAHRYFSEAPRWEILERSGTQPVVIEKAFGKGTVVLVADSRLFSNESAAAGRHTALLAQIIGGHTRIVFDEAHLGIVESGSVVALARRYRLHGLALGLALVAALFIWRNATSFPPVAAAPREEKVAGRTSVAGLVTLLRRHIAPDRLASACWQEWLKSHARNLIPPVARRPKTRCATTPAVPPRRCAKSKPSCARKEKFEFRSISSRHRAHHRRDRQGDHRPAATPFASRWW